MRYIQSDYERYLGEFNNELFLSEKVTFLYKGENLNGTVFIDDLALTFIRSKDNYIYRIPIEEIEKYEKQTKFLSYTLELYYGEYYHCKLSFMDKNSLESFESTLKVLLISISKYRIDKVNMTDEVNKLREIELSKIFEEKKRYRKYFEAKA